MFLTGRHTSFERWYWGMLPFSIVSGMISPLMLVYVMVYLKGGVLESSFVMLLTAAGSIAGALLGGYISGKYQKRRTILVIGFVGSGITIFSMFFTVRLDLYYVLAFLFGVMSNTIATVAPSLVVESTRKMHWAEHLGKFNAICSSGHMLGSLTAFLWLMLFPGGLTWLFILCLLLGLVSAYLAHAWILEPEEKITEMPHLPHHLHVWIVERIRAYPASLFHTPHIIQHWHDIRPHRTHRVVWFTLAVFLAFMGFTSFYAILPAFMVINIGLEPSHVFIVFMIQSFASLIVHLPAGKWIDRHGYRAPLACSTFGRAALFSIGFPGVPMITGYGLGILLAFLGLNFVSGVLWSLFSISTVAGISSLVPKKKKSGALGVYTSMQGLGTLFGVPIMGVVAAVFGYTMAFSLIAVIIVCGGVIGVITLTRIRKV